MNAPMSKAAPESKVEILTMDDGTKLPNLDAAIERTGQIQALLPRSIDEAYRLAQAIVQSGLAPDSYKRNRDDRTADVQMVHIGIMKSMEVGIPPITGLGVIAIINNKPCIWGDGAVALIQSKGVLQNMTATEIGTVPGESDETGKFSETHTFENDYGIEVKMWRKGQTEPYIGRFTVADAKRAKLWMNPKRQPWMLYPRRQLKWRAFGWAARDGFADCLSGLQIREEVEDLPVAPKKVDSSFLDDAPTPDAIEDQKPEPTAQDEPAPTEPEGQGDLLGDQESPGKKLSRLVADVMAADTEEKVKTVALKGVDLPEAQKAELDEAAEAQLGYLAEKATA